MDLSGTQNPVLQQVNQLWSMLDDMSLNCPESYRAFIDKQLREGKDFCSPPQPDSCIRVEILGPKQGILYINVCGWRRVPAPSSPQHPVPVCGGKMENYSEAKEQYSVLDVAFNPEVVERAQQDPQEREQLHLLAMSFAQQQHGLSLAQHFTTLSTSCKGGAQGVKDRLASPRQQQQPATPPARASTAPSLLQQISSLRGGGENDDDPSSVTLDLCGVEQQARPGLIQLISSSVNPLPRCPNHRLGQHAGTEDIPASLELTVELPEVRSVTQCQLSISQDDILLEVENLYRLHLDLSDAVNEESATATFNKRTHTLTLTVSVL